MTEEKKQTKPSDLKPKKAEKDPAKATPKKSPKASDTFDKKKAELLAVIKTGGKQYLVEPGRNYDFEKIEGEVGSSVVFDEVYLLMDGESVQVGKPKLSIKVTGKIVEQFKDDKVKVFKYKKRKRIRKTYGHRQPLTKVEITKIG